MDDVMEWVFNAPWWIQAAAAVVGVFVLLWAMNRGDKPVVRGAAVAVGLVAVWALLALLVQTPTEKAVDRVTRLVEAFDAGNWEEFGEIIEDDTRFAGWLMGQQITQAAQETKEDRGIGAVTIRGLEVQRDDAGIRVVARVQSTHTHLLVSQLSTMWRFDFNRRQDQWRLEHIEPLATDRLDVPSILRQIVPPSELSDR